MANTPVKDANSTTVYLKSTGAGSDGDPYIQVHQIGAGTATIGAVFNPTVTPDSSFTGIGTVTGAGTAVQGSNISNTNGFYLKAHPNNTDTIWVFYWGGSKESGFPLDSGELVIISAANLNLLGFDADVSGEKYCWMKG